MIIDFIFDPVCAWCYIGKRRLEAALALRPEITPRIRWWPFLLNPELPPEGIDITAYRIKKFASETRIRSVYGAIENVGQSLKINFNFAAIKRTPNTVNAHRLVQFAGRSGKASAMVEALFNAYFIDAKDIGKLEVLARTGKSLGFTLKELRNYLKTDADKEFIYEENAAAHRMGVNAIPTFAFNGDMVISGAQDAHVLARLIDAAAVG